MDPMFGATMAGGFLDFLTSMKNYGLQSRVAGDNYRLAKEQFKWQQGEANLTRQREDTAIQRRAADMQAAGLNPLLAAGSPAASSTPISSPVSVRKEAPQLKFSVMDQVQVAQALRLGQANVSRVQAENALLMQQARKAAADADLAEFDLSLYKDDYFNPTSGRESTLRGHKMFLDTELVNRKGGLLANQAVESYARSRNLDASTAARELETSIRERDFSKLKEFGVLDDRGNIARDWLDFATLFNRDAFGDDPSVNAVLDFLQKITPNIFAYRRLFKK